MTAPAELLKRACDLAQEIVAELKATPEGGELVKALGDLAKLLPSALTAELGQREVSRLRTLADAWRAYAGALNALHLAEARRTTGNRAIPAEEIEVLGAAQQRLLDLGITPEELAALAKEPRIGARRAV
jgi:uncharacterized Zn finger protein